MKILARHKNWVSRATITESYDQNDIGYRRFTATILGWGGWEIYEGKHREGLVEEIINKVREIKEKIEQGDDDIFKHKGYFITN